MPVKHLALPSKKLLVDALLVDALLVDGKDALTQSVSVKSISGIPEYVLVQDALSQSLQVKSIRGIPENVLVQDALTQSLAPVKSTSGILELRSPELLWDGSSQVRSMTMIISDLVLVASPDSGSMMTLNSHNIFPDAMLLSEIINWTSEGFLVPR